MRLGAVARALVVDATAAEGVAHEIGVGDLVAPERAFEEHADAQALLRAAQEHAQIYRFELVEPSLEEIFIQTVGEKVDA